MDFFQTCIVFLRVSYIFCITVETLEECLFRLKIEDLNGEFVWSSIYAVSYTLESLVSSIQIEVLIGDRIEIRSDPLESRCECKFFAMLVKYRRKLRRGARISFPDRIPG